MSYLILPDGVPDFSTAVISLWFRVPQESVDAAHEAFVAEGQFHKPLSGIITLVVMGETGIASNGGPTAPTYLGINCTNAATVYFVGNFESNEKAATVSGVSFETDTMHIGYHAVPISADHWHHALISVDFSGPMVTHGYAWDAPIFSPDLVYPNHVDAAAQLYMAFDDVNLLGADLSGDYPFGYGDLNGVVTPDGLRVANTVQATADIPNAPPGQDRIPVGPIPSYSGSMSIPSGPIGVPGTPEFMEHIYHVEMAEFQMFTGVAVDTADESVRRAFIDKNGKPVPPDKKSSKTDPTSGSIALLGKPTVLLHGSSNWIKGKDTGRAGQFQPTGLIKKYKPDPSLHGQQGP